MQSSAAHIYVISAASVTVRWHILIAGQCSMFEGCVFPDFDSSNINAWSKCQGLPFPRWWGGCRGSPCGGRSFLPGVTILMSSPFFSRGMQPVTWWCLFSFMNELFGFLSLNCMYYLFQSLLDLECQNPELRGSSGGVEGGSLRLLMDFCIFSGLISSSSFKIVSNFC